MSRLAKWRVWGVSLTFILLWAAPLAAQDHPAYVAYQFVHGNPGIEHALTQDEFDQMAKQFKSFSEDPKLFFHSVHKNRSAVRVVVIVQYSEAPSMRDKLVTKLGKQIEPVFFCVGVDIGKKRGHTIVPVMLPTGPLFRTENVSGPYGMLDTEVGLAIADNILFDDAVVGINQIEPENDETTKWYPYEIAEGIWPKIKLKKKMSEAKEKQIEDSVSADDVETLEQLDQERWDRKRITIESEGLADWARERVEEGDVYPDHSNVAEFEKRPGGKGFDELALKGVQRVVRASRDHHDSRSGPADYMDFAKFDGFLGVTKDRTVRHDGRDQVTETICSPVYEEYAHIRSRNVDYRKNQRIQFEVAVDATLIDPS